MIPINNFNKPEVPTKMNYLVAKFAKGWFPKEVTLKDIVKQYSYSYPSDIDLINFILIPTLVNFNIDSIQVFKNVTKELLDPFYTRLNEDKSTSNVIIQCIISEIRLLIIPDLPQNEYQMIQGKQDEELEAAQKALYELQWTK